MIVVGIGCKKGVSAAEIVDSLQAALDALNLDEARLGLVASSELKRDEAGLSEAATLLDLPLMLVDDARLQAVANRCVSSSQASLDATGLPSLSEAAALVAAGPGGRLLGARMANEGVTIAFGATRDEPEAAEDNATAGEAGA